jgi:hypothetical protein
MKYFWSILIMLVMALMAGCQSHTTQQPNPTSNQPTASSTQSSQQGYPAPDTATAPTGYPSPATPEPKILTAFQAYQIAQPYALKWNPKAVLYAIPATYQQEINFGHPTNTEGWYFMFKDPNAPLEYYVYIWNGTFAGGIEAQQILTGKAPPYVYQPLPDFSKMIDSDKFTELYMKNGGDKYLADNPKAVLNPQLTFLESDKFPIWRMFDGSNIKDNKVLFAVNALTGEVVPPD